MVYGKSGNPGYVIGLTVMSGQLVSNPASSSAPTSYPLPVDLFRFWFPKQLDSHQQYRMYQTTLLVSRWHPRVLINCARVLVWMIQFIGCRLLLVKTHSPVAPSPTPSTIWIRIATAFDRQSTPYKWAAPTLKWRTWANLGIAVFWIWVISSTDLFVIVFAMLCWELEVNWWLNNLLSFD